MKSTSIAIAVVAIVVIVIVIAAAAMFMSVNSSSNNVTPNGTKVDFKNNNTQYWTHIDFVVVNATGKNGTTGNYYGEVWIKPGENETLDLSNLFGYNNTALPVGTTVKMYVWTGPFGNSSGTTNLNDTLRGWSNSSTPVTAFSYNLTDLNMPVGTLPSNITNTTIAIGNSSAIAPNTGNVDAFTSFFEQVIFTVNSNGDLTITFSMPGGLSQTIAREV